jgi:hypothetical protein
MVDDKKLDELDEAIAKLDVPALGSEKPISSVARVDQQPFRPRTNVTTAQMREPTLVEQMNRAEEIQASLRNKIRREKLDMLQEHDRRWTEVKQTYANLIHDAVTKLEAERDKALRDLTDAYNVKAREHDLLLDRMS